MMSAFPLALTHSDFPPSVDPEGFDRVSGPARTALLAGFVVSTDHSGVSRD